MVCVGLQAVAHAAMSDVMFNFYMDITSSLFWVHLQADLFNYVSFSDFGTANKKAIAKAEKSIEWTVGEEYFCGFCGAHLLPSTPHRKWDYDEHPSPPFYPGWEMADPTQCGDETPTVVAGGAFW